jgi:hypothetical protein
MTATILYFIASHTNPRQVERLARVLKNGNNDNIIVVHHDPRNTPAPDLSPIHNAEPYPEPSQVQWGDFSQVQMFFNVVCWALERYSFDWLVFLSGQDYPIRNVNIIESDLALSQMDVFLTAHPIESHPIWRSQEGFDRYLFQYFELPRFPYAYRIPLLVASLQKFGYWMNHHNPFIRYRWMPQGLPGRLGLRFPSPFKPGFTCHGGPQWGNFSRRSLEYLCHFVDEHPEVLKHYKRTLNPDESCVLSIFQSAANQGILRINSDNRRYVNWENEKTDPSPQVILSKDFDRIIASGMDFARKFDTRIDQDILDRIDREIHGISPP